MSNATSRTRRPRGSGRAAPAASRYAHRMFEEQARSSPDAVALASDGRNFSYAELDARANRLARRLRSLGVGPEVLVGVCLSRSPEMLVALLAVLKAGGAYLPIDPALPEARIDYMLGDASVPVLLTQLDLRDRLPEADAAVLCIDSEWDEHDGPDAEPIELLPENLAYVIYTSGSTGQPKGVQVTQAALANLLRSLGKIIGIGPDDVLLAVTTLSFDIAALELFLPLVVGARVELAGREEAGDGRLLAERLVDSGVTVLQATPASWRMLVESGWEGKPGLTMLCGGEALPRPLADRLLPLGKVLWNVYGPTETTIWSSAWRVEAGEGSVAIGRPIANTRLYVVDRHFQPVPVGVTGELYIGGLGLARGYLNRPGLTAERFLPDPFGEVPGARLYRTGDLARWRSDGQLEYVGRVDHQLKIRGFRIEAGEVEAALLAHPLVREAVVVGREDNSGELALVAYVVVDPSSTAPSPVEFRRFLGTSLPDPMVPSAFVSLEALPLTPNGKVDRKALPPLGDAVPPASTAEFVPPRGMAEEVVAAAWASVLGLGRVGALDNFFDLGGHSLLATQVISRLRDGFGVEVPLRALFEGPTVAGLAERIEAIRRMGEHRDTAPILPLKGTGPRPLSFAQEALWVLHQLAPDQPTFNITAAVRVEGPLDVAALGLAVDAMVARHETLRTTFEVVDGRPLMVVAPSLELPIELVDLSGLPPESRQGEAARRAVEEARRPFDLARGPMARVVVLRLGESDHAVLLAMHHIMTDGWSFGVAARELSTLYESRRRGLPSPLPPLPIQYADFAAWQRERRQAPAWAEQVESWRRRLAGVPPLELATDHPRPPVRSMRGAHRPFSLPADLSDAVRDLGRRAGVTPFMTLLAAFQVVLSRWSGQDDFAVGSPVANRTRAETEGLIGYFVNMLALRADLSGDPTALGLLARVREVSLEAFEHQEIPLEVVIESLSPRRDASRTPLFQVMFVLQNNAMPEIGTGGLTLSPLNLPSSGTGTGTAKFELTLSFSDTPGGFFGSIEYAVDLFDEATIDRLARHYEAVVRAIVADPEAKLSGLTLISDEERQVVLDEWSGADSAGAEPSPFVHERFEALARRTPDAPALIAADGRWTYSDLDAGANRLARLLIDRGVGPEVRVALLLSRPSSQLRALLAVLKAGGAYVPIDPSMPAERLEGMLVDARVSVAIVEDGTFAGSALTTIDLGAIGADLEGLSPESPKVSTDESNLAYVVFTSGSTGRPKGVEVTHAALASAANAWADAYGLLDAPRPHLQAAPFAFDVFAGDWARALGTGGSLVACPRETLIDPAALVDLMVRERVGCAELVPPVAEALAGELERRGLGLPALRLLAVGSDTLRARLYGRLRRLLGPACRVVNSYGLTEATIDSSVFEGDWPEADDRPVPIGRPFAGTRLYILNRWMRPSPPGVAGELYVGGAGVARGYASDPRRTASRFVPDPFGEPGGRLYRTGDRARWTAEGQVELLGRLDGQVKIRGQRVELGEVETALLRHESVAEAVAVASPAEPDGVRLVAYVAGPPGRGVAVEEVRRSLRERLPRAMIPSRIVALEALPRTPSGKVDREALPPPNEGRGEDFVPPRDDLERRVAAIWEDLLAVRPIGATDDFFDLGGHSLLAVRLASRVEEEFGRSLPLSSLFRSTTIEGLAERLRDPVWGRASSPLSAFGAPGQARSLAMVHPVSGSILCYGQLARLLEDQFSLFGFQANGLEGDGEPETDLVRMATRYVDALLEARPDGPYRLGGWSMGGVVAFEMARQLEARGREVDLVVLIDSLPPGHGPGFFGLDERDYLVAFANDLVRISGSDPAPLIERLKRVDVGAIEFDSSIFGPELIAEFGPARLRRHFEVFRANRRALTAYQPEPYRGRAVLIRAAESPDRSRAWRGLVRGGLTTHTLPGDHVALLQRPGVFRLAEILALEAGVGTVAR